MNLKSFVENSTKKLSAAQIKSAAIDIKILVSDYYNFEFHELIINEDLAISEKDELKLSERVKRRLLGEPVAYILGYKYFYKSKFKVNSDVLIPRPETELLVEEALKWLDNKKNINILDMGAGSGCLGQSVLKELNEATLLSIDVCDKACALAIENSKKLGLFDKVKFINNDINSFSVNEFANSFDLILANPPYIDRDIGFVEKNVKKFEPSIALFSEDQGLKDIKLWTERAASWLKPGGLYLMEFGDDQAQIIEKIFKQNNFFMDISQHKDYADLPRYMKAIK